MKSKFSSLRMNTSFIREVDCVSTGIAPISVDNKGNNCIIVVPGANSLLSESDVETATSAIAASRILLCQMEVPIEATLTALKIARAQNVLSLLNIAPAQRKHLSLISLADIVCINETELELLTGLPVKSISSATESARKLFSSGARSLLITLGSDGVLWIPQESEVHHIPSFPVKAVDTTGAGDCFLGALSFFYANSDSNTLTPEMISKASFVASLSVQKNGTQSSYPSMETVCKEGDGFLF
eukprot:GCRY01001861.1.p1 GENE.GCRY01001861.1~~GCRY01001861.1.p1  ORF type:complete len:267 (-),score=21.57 GCRY01001861.1:111-839(-)